MPRQEKIKKWRKISLLFPQQQLPVNPQAETTAIQAPITELHATKPQQIQPTLNPIQHELTKLQAEADLAQQRAINY